MGLFFFGNLYDYLTVDLLVEAMAIMDKAIKSGGLHDINREDGDTLKGS